MHPGPPDAPRDVSLGARAPRVLVVEDERLVAVDLKAVLHRVGYVMAGMAASGEEALELCRTVAPDIVLMDIFLEGSMDGVEAACRVRDDYGIPVIFLTGHADQITVQRAKRSAPYGYVLKPVDPNWLRTAVEVALCKHQAEQELRRSELRYRQLFTRMLNACLLLELLPGDGESVDFRILDANPAFEKMTGLTLDAVRSRSLREMLPGIEPVWLERFMEAASPGASVCFENFLAVRNLYLVAQAYCPQEGQVAVVLEDVTERKHSEERLRYRIFHDNLTGLPNRALCLERIGQAMNKAREQANCVFALIFLDLDRFRLVNDSLGHLVGDGLLRRVANQLRRELRPHDTVARVGGDEFAVLLENVATPAEALRLAKSLREQLRRPVVVDGHQIHVTASLGVVLGPGGYDRPEEVLQNAAIAMYNARRSGQGRLRVFDWSMREQAERVMDLETSLRQALEAEQFVLHFQPVFDLKTLVPVGVEALVRWWRPGVGLVPPEEFIAAAEQTGVIVPLGALVLRLACRTMVRWREDSLGDRPFAMAVNVSAYQFAQPDCVKQVVRILRETGMRPTDLRLEITESVLMENPESAMLKLRSLKELGIGIAIDDFGTGYSSLAYLQRFPIDVLKVDRGFVSGMDEHGNKMIVRSVVHLAHNLGYAVVAEGIETLAQLDELAGLGCDLGQGFFYAKPLEEPDVLGLLDRTWGDWPKL